MVRALFPLQPTPPSQRADTRRHLMHIEVHRLWPRRPRNGSLPLGLSCDSEGLLLAGNCRLIAAALTPEGHMFYRSRPPEEINAVLSAGYGVAVDIADAYPRIERLAQHMSRGEWTRATVAALNLRLPELPDQAAARRVLAADQFLKVAWNSDLHPRWPAHSEDSQGGRFRSDDGSDGLLVPASDETEGKGPKPPIELPANRQPTKSELNRYGREQSAATKPQVMGGVKTRAQAIGQFMDATGLTDKIGGELAEIFFRFKTRFDDPKTLDELQARARGTKVDRLGYENHHIVEVTPNDGKIPDELLQGRDNIVSIPYYLHRDISDFYSRKNKDYDNKTPRDWLRGKSFEEQYQEGLKIMRQFGALK
jgi:hypothetical protein